MGNDHMPERPSQDSVAPAEANEQTLKRCPNCAEAIQAQARICRFCGTDQSTGQLPKGQPQVAISTKDKRAFGCSGVVALFILLVVFASQCSPSKPIGSGADQATMRLTDAQLAACKEGAKKAERLGLIRERRQRWIVVDERIWAEMSWTQKKDQMICAAGIDQDGGLSDVIMVKGYRSGKVLAGGSPGHGTLSAE